MTKAEISRINRDWRFCSLIQGDIYHVVDIIPHPKKRANTPTV